MSAFIGFVAAPNTTKGFVPSCPPQTVQEMQMAAQSTGEAPSLEGAGMGWGRAMASGHVGA